jgi:2-keto-4-pentenoate hydratase/2-oxohepta-3-ene-1,7-dioic acid hydratase in catechol pathway
MRLATVVDAGRVLVGAVRDDRFVTLPADDPAAGSIRVLAAAGPDAIDRVGSWLDRQPADTGRPIADVVLGPALPEPGAIFTIGLNYRWSDEAPGNDRPDRPLVYGKLPTSVAAHGAVLAWDRSLTPNVDAECELGVVLGRGGSVFGYTIVNDVSSRDPWLDGDQWLLGKSLPGFCPIGPWIVTADALDATDLRLGCTINGAAIQDGTTADLRFSIAEVIAFLARHTTLGPADLIATGTPARLATPPGPDRHLEPGDLVTAWIEGIGELTTTIG